MEYSTPHSTSSTLSRLEVENILQAHWHVCSRSRLPIELSQTGYVLLTVKQTQRLLYGARHRRQKGVVLIYFRGSLLEVKD